MQYAAALKPILLPEDYNSCFGNLGPIHMLHTQMAARLSPNTIFATVIGMLSYFKMYGQLRGSEQLCAQATNRILKDEKVKTAISKFKKEAKTNLDIPFLMALVPKRLSEIEESIQEILDSLGTGTTQQHIHAAKAYTQIKLLNIDLNEQADISKSGFLLLQLSKETENLPEGFEVMIPSRRFIAECSAFVKLEKAVIRHSCQVFLFTDSVFVLFKKEEGKEKKGLFKSKKSHATYHCEHILLIDENTTCVLSTNDEDLIGEIVVISNPNLSTLYIHTEDAKRWHFLLKSAVDVIVSAKATFTKATIKVKQPVVVPAPESSPKVASTFPGQSPVSGSNLEAAPGSASPTLETTPLERKEKKKRQVRSISQGGPSPSSVNVQKPPHKKSDPGKPKKASDQPVATIEPPKNPNRRHSRGLELGLEFLQGGSGDKETDKHKKKKRHEDTSPVKGSQSERLPRRRGSDDDFEDDRKIADSAPSPKRRASKSRDVPKRETSTTQESPTHEEHRSGEETVVAAVVAAEIKIEAVPTEGTTPEEPKKEETGETK